MSPDFPQDNMLIGATEYDLLRSVDRGKTWESIPIPDWKLETHRALSVAFSPDFATDKTLFVSSRYGGDIYTSHDRGASFQRISKINQDTEVDRKKVLSFETSPSFSDDKTLFVMTANTLQISTDEGQSWSIQAIPGNLVGQLRQLVISPNFQADQTLFLATHTGLYRSDDAGRNWKIISSDEVAPTDSIATLALSPNYAVDQTALFVIQDKGVFATETDFQSIDPVGQQFLEEDIPLRFYESLQSTSKSLQFSPTYSEDQTIYAFGSTTAELWSSTDIGQTWTHIPIPYQIDYGDEIAALGYEIPFALRHHKNVRLIFSGCVALMFAIIAGEYGGFSKILNRRWKRQIFGATFVFLLALFSLSI